MSLGRAASGCRFLQLVPNLVTILGLCAGLTALRFAFAGRFEQAAALIILAALLDGFDGLLARKLDAASPFGAELDSLADFLNFGVAPAFLVYQFALGRAADLGWTAALVFAVCACLRLARFNVSRDVPVDRAGRTSSGCRRRPGRCWRCCRRSSTFAGLADAAALPWLVAPWLAAVGPADDLPAPHLRARRGCGSRAAGALAAGRRGAGRRARLLALLAADGPARPRLSRQPRPCAGRRAAAAAQPPTGE